MTEKLLEDLNSIAKTGFTKQELEDIKKNSKSYNKKEPKMDMLLKI